MQDKKYIINIAMDEMSIRQQINYANNRFFGGVYMGTGMDGTSDIIRDARNTLIFMAVAINGGWKVPLGYFLIQSLSGSERVNLLTRCLELLNNLSNIQVRSITFADAPLNITMCTALGANFEYGSQNFKPWFVSPVRDDKYFIFWDPCDMIKLFRNTLGDKKIIYTEDD